MKTHFSKATSLVGQERWWWPVCPEHGRTVSRYWGYWYYCPGVGWHG